MYLKRVLFTIAVFLSCLSTTQAVHDQAIINAQVNLEGVNTPASATHFTASLTSNQENPPKPGNGVGTGAFVLDAQGLHYWITVSGLSTTLSAAHFHNAPTGQNGGVVREITFNGTSASGVWTSTNSQPLTPALIQEIIAGNVYVNVHTPNHPSGEIRGQVQLSSGIRLVADLTGQQENPPLTSNGRGTGVFVWNADGLHYWLTVNGLSGTINAAHFHNAPTGQNGGVVREITFNGNSASGVWTRSDSRPLTPELLNAILAGNIYVNVHTAQNPSGEIRGQVTMQPGIGFIASLDGTQENPPISGSGQGTGVFILNSSGLHYWVTVAGLTGTVNAAHFHNAPTGQNGGVVQEIAFTGTTAIGTWASESVQVERLLAGNLYVNVHTSANPSGEIRGQVVLPNPGTSGLEIAFSRSIAGLSPDYAWSAPLGPGGKAAVNILAKPDLLGRIVGANGYYSARLHNPATGQTVTTWNSIPINGGQNISLNLPVGGPAKQNGPGSPIEAAAKTATTEKAFIAEANPRVPIVSLSKIEQTSDNTVIVPLRLTQAHDLAGGAWTLTYDPQSLTFLHGFIQDQKAQTIETQSGQVTFVIDALANLHEATLQLVFDRKDTTPNSLNLDGFFFNNQQMPILAFNENISLTQGLPSDYALGQNHPNPFNPATQIRYTLPTAGQVRLTIYNTLGQQVAELFNGPQEAGIHIIRWNATNMASGIYYYRLEANNFSDTRKMMLIK